MSPVSRAALAFSFVAATAHAQTAAQLVAQVDAHYAPMTTYRADVRFVLWNQRHDVSSTGAFVYAKAHDQFAFSAATFRLMSDATRVCSSEGALPARQTLVEPRTQSIWTTATMFLRGLGVSGFGFSRGSGPNVLVAMPRPGSPLRVIFQVDLASLEVTRVVVSDSATETTSGFEFANPRMNEPIGPQAFTAPIWGTNLNGVPPFTKVCP